MPLARLNSLKKLFIATLLLLAATTRSSAQVPSFIDTMDMISRSWKLASFEGLKDSSIHLEKQIGTTLVFFKDFTYISKTGDSITERGVWAIDREKRWLMPMPDKNMTFVCRIEKLTAQEWKLAIEINEDKILLTLIPSEHN